MAGRSSSVLPLVLLLGLAAVAAVSAAGAAVEDDGGAAGGARRWLQDLSDGSSTAVAATNATTGGFISYLALLPDTVPCSIPGASYYNCRPGGDANPYTRGCSAIAQCRD